MSDIASLPIEPIPTDPSIGKPKPKIESFWTINDLPYEFDKYEIVTAFSELVHAGARQIVATHHLRDANLPPAPETPEEVMESTAP